MSDNIFLNKIWNPEKGEFEPLSQDVLSKYINNFMEGRDNIQTGGGGKKGGKGQGIGQGKGASAAGGKEASAAASKRFINTFDIGNASTFKGTFDNIINRRTIIK